MVTHSLGTVRGLKILVSVVRFCPWRIQQARLAFGIFVVVRIYTPHWKAMLEGVYAAGRTALLLEPENLAKLAGVIVEVQVDFFRHGF